MFSFISVALSTSLHCELATVAGGGLSTFIIHCIDGTHCIYPHPWMDGHWPCWVDLDGWL